MQNAVMTKILNKNKREAAHPGYRPGDTIRVHVKIKEGDKERLQVFEGVGHRQHNTGMGETITVRKVSFGQGVERIFPIERPGGGSYRCRPHGPRSPRQAVLSARVEGQGRPSPRARLTVSDLSDAQQPLTSVAARCKRRTIRVASPASDESRARGAACSVRYSPPPWCWIRRGRSAVSTIASNWIPSGAQCWHERIRERAAAWAVAGADAFEIDRVNILQASRLAMKRAVGRLSARQTSF